MPQGNVRPLRGITRNNPIFSRRWKTKWAATLQTVAAQWPCTVTDISVAGARLRFDRSPDDESAVVHLFIGNRRAISARVVWCRADSVGLCFVEEQPWILGLISPAESDRPSHTPNHRS
jgi:hypothetical protein